MTSFGVLIYNHHREFISLGNARKLHHASNGVFEIRTDILMTIVGVLDASNGVFEIRTDILTTIVGVLDACNGVFEIRTDILTTIVGVLDA